VKLLTVREAAEIAAISLSLMYAILESRALPHIRLGRAGRRGTIRIAEDDLERYLQNCRREGRPAAVDEGPLKHLR